MQVIETALFLDSAAYRRFKSYFTSIGFYLNASIIEFVYKLPNSRTCFSLFHNICHFEITFKRRAKQEFVNQQVAYQRMKYV